MTDHIKFSDLVNQHGEIQAMRQLEAIETIAWTQRQMALLRQQPEKRLEKALQDLVA